MPLVTKLTTLLGIKHPIVQGGMHNVSYAELCAAVSNAGGLGTITALTQSSAEDLRKEIRKCKTLTDKPFGVNLTLLPALAPPDYDSYAKVVIEEKIPVVETAGNNPGKFIKMFKEAGIIVIHKCVAIRHALSAQKLGVDILSIDGFECAGHPGEDDVPNLILLARAAEELSIPFIASGGIGNGAQLAACLALGAEGVNMGTRFMATKECLIRDEIKQALVDGNELSTTHVFRTLKNTERVYKNEMALKVRKLEAEKPGDFNVVRPFVSGKLYAESFYKTGDLNSSVWSAGMVMGLIHDVPTCQELLERMVSDAEKIINGRLTKLIQPAKL